MTPEQKKIIPLFLTLAFISFALRLYHVNQGLWFDEIHTLAFYAGKDLHTILTSLKEPNNHILFSLLAKISITIFGISEWSFRLPSVIIGGLTPPVCYLLFRKKAGELPAFLAGIFMSLSFWMVWYSQDGRGYAGLILFSTLSQVLYLDGREKGGNRIAVLYLASAAISAYFFLYGIFVIAGQIVYGFLIWLRAGKEKKMMTFLLPAIALAVVLVLYAPGLPDLLSYALSPQGGRNLESAWFNLRFFRDLAETLSGSHFLWVAVFMGAISVLGLFRLFKLWPGLVYLYLLATGLLIFSILAARVFICARFLTFLIPFFFLSAAAAIDWFAGAANKRIPLLKKNIIVIAFATLICFCLAVSLARYYKLGKQGFKDAALYIQKSHPGKPVVSFGMANIEFLFYCPDARPHPGVKPLSPDDVRGGMLVAFYPQSWSPGNVDFIRRFCELEKEWPSAGYDNSTVYLYHCFNKIDQNEGPGK